MTVSLIGKRSVAQGVMVALVGVGLAWAPATVSASVPVPAATPGASKSDALAPHVAGEIIVGFEAGAGSQRREEVRRAVGARGSVPLSGLANDAEVLTLGSNMGVARAIEALTNAPGVRFVEPNYVLTTTETSNDPDYLSGNLWGMLGASTSPSNAFGGRAGEAWANGYIGSSDVVIGVIDEGIDVTHPDLVNNIWTSPGEIAGNGIDDDANGFIDDVYGFDFVNNDGSVLDSNADSHGTHVAGTIGAEGGNGVGVAGVNWNVSMISAKFLQGGSGSSANAVRAVDYITGLKQKYGLNIIATSNSWGGGGFSQALLDAIERGGDAGILFIAAAGNSAVNNDAGGYYPSGCQ
ncbi:MAG: S8 family serine peptidase, partial [Actinomycetota bacterium]